MTNYFLPVAAMAALSSAVCAAGEAPAVPAAARYTQSANSGNLTFVFVQADAENKGAFRKFSTELVYDEKNLAAGKLDVTVQIASLDTQDKDRDDTLKGADLLDAAKHPTAHYSAASLVRTASGGIEAVGKLTLRGVTRDLRVPLTLRATAGGLEISGETAIRRLDFGVGQGEWQSTEWVGNDVKLQFKVPLSRAG